MATVKALNIELYKGDWHAISPVPAQPIPTGASVSMTLRPYLSDDVVTADVWFVVGSEALTVTFPGAFSTNADWRVAEYEIQADANGNVTTLFEGEIRLVERDTATHNGATVTTGNTNATPTPAGGWEVVTLPEATEDFNNI